MVFVSTINPKHLLKSTFAKALLLICAILVAVPVIFILITGFNDDIRPSDVIVVLGNKIESNGEPSERLKSRLVKAKQLFDQKMAPLIIVSGGVGKEGFQEAEVMKAYLVTHQIPSSAIITDQNGTDSYQTAKNAKSILDQRNLSSAIVVSNYYHIARTKLAFQKFDTPLTTSAHATFFEIRDLYSILREIPAYYYYLFRRR